MATTVALYQGRHSAPPPDPRHRNISQHAMQQGYTQLKLENVIIKNTYYYYPIFCNDGDGVHVKQHAKH